MKRKAEVAEVHRDRELAAVLSKTEIMVLNFYQRSCLSQRRGRALMDLMKHPNFPKSKTYSLTQ